MAQQPTPSAAEEPTSRRPRETLRQPADDGPAPRDPVTDGSPAGHLPTGHADARPRSIEEILAEPEPDVLLRCTVEVNRMARYVAASATTRLVGFWDNSPRTAQLFEAPLAAHRRQVAATRSRPPHTQFLFESSVLTYPQTTDVLDLRCGGWGSVRVLERIPFSLLIADNELGLLDLTTYERVGAGSRLVRNRSTLLSLLALSDTLWNMAIPVRSGHPTELDSSTQHVLGLLAAGATDSEVAEHTGLSVRTVERRVQRLFSLLGASTRFQAGAQAARRGWI